MENRVSLLWVGASGEAHRGIYRVLSYDFMESPSFVAANSK
jgi:hypothetical protein